MIWVVWQHATQHLYAMTNVKGRPSFRVALFGFFKETIYFLTYVDCQSLAHCRAASRRDAISVTPYVVWGMRINNIYDGCRCPTLRYARIG